MIVSDLPPSRRVETIIGNWLKSRGGRDKVIIATKVGSDMGLGRKCLAKTYVRSAIDASLKRLQTDYIDLYQSHWDDPDTPMRETLEAYAELMKEGKVRAIGASNFSAARLEEALEMSARTGLPRYESFSPSTICMSAPATRLSLSLCAVRITSVSSATIRWQAGS